MPTDTEAAAAWRVLADQAAQQGLTQLAADRRTIADTLDPPNPTYPDGLYRWDYSDGWIIYVTRRDGAWLDGRGKPDTNVQPQAGTKITRVRVLDGHHLALPVVTVRADLCRLAAEDMPIGSATAAVLLAYAAAVDDALAGDRS